MQKKKSKARTPAARKHATPPAKAKTSAKQMKAANGKQRKGPQAARSNGGGDIVKLILEDHKPLKKLIKILKDSDKDLSTREKAFDEFASLLTIHAKSEEEIVYVHMKGEDELREEGFEGDVEHGLADQMVEEAKRTEDEDLWSARVKVLAELVEHHIEEEEDELLPDFKKHTELEERSEMGEQYLALKEKVAVQIKEESARKPANVETSQFQAM